MKITLRKSKRLRKRERGLLPRLHKPLVVSPVFKVLVIGLYQPLATELQSSLLLQKYCSWSGSSSIPLYPSSLRKLILKINHHNHSYHDFYPPNLPFLTPVCLPPAHLPYTSKAICRDTGAPLLPFRWAPVSNHNLLTCWSALNSGPQKGRSTCNL